MLKLLCAICIGLAAVSAVCQSTGKYQVGTITSVKPHQAGSSALSGDVSYDVCVKVADTVYVLLYTPPLGMNTVRYAAGRELLVLVGKQTLTYNDLLGQSYEVPIVSRKPAEDTKQTK
jgi:outer membrane lipoprotein-sorting protein